MAVTYQITPPRNGGLQGTIQVPGDKSISHRALMLAAIAEGESVVDGLLLGADNLATLTALRQLGVSIELSGERATIQGVGRTGLKPAATPLDLGNSGTGIRLLTGLLAGQSFDTQLTGDDSLQHRPMRRIVDPLRQMGANINPSTTGTPPLHIAGNCPLQGIHYALPIASAQVKSCLLLAGLYANGTTTLTEPGISRDHTERMLQAFGYPVHVKPQQVQLVGGGHLKATHIAVPGDLSSAAFFIVAATIIPHSCITLKNVGINPTRLGIIHILRQMGADIVFANERQAGAEPIADLIITARPLRGITIPIEQVPLAIDEFPIIFIAAAVAQGQTILTHAAELRVKESDRLQAMAEGLTQLGITNQLLADGLVIDGGTFRDGGDIDSFGDHRIAMAFSIAGALAQKPVTIRNCDNVATSFPHFTALANQLGLSIHETSD